jgi:hypothetical protein
VAYGVFEEDAPDRYGLNAAAELLRRDVPGSQRAGVLFTAGDMTWQLWLDFLESVRTGHSVVERTFGRNVFERHAENSEESALFGQAMAAFSAALSAPLIAAYDFSSFKCIADVGGGTGRLLADILAANPKAQGILFDLPDVTTAAPSLLEASGVAGRCKLVAGNFFEGVPVGADALRAQAYSARLGRRACHRDHFELPKSDGTQRNIADRRARHAREGGARTSSGGVPR